MAIRRDEDADAATQYLIWALEEIEKIGNKKATHHARLAIKELRRAVRSDKAETS